MDKKIITTREIRGKMYDLIQIDSGKDEDTCGKCPFAFYNGERSEHCQAGVSVNNCLQGVGMIWEEVTNG